MFKEYLIKKGCHYPERRGIGTHFGSKKISYVFKFSKECWYDTEKHGAHINKLYGLAYIPHHHYRSIRIGWKPHSVEGLVSTYAYWYDSIGKFRTRLIKVVNTEEEYYSTIGFVDPFFNVGIDDKKIYGIINIPFNMGYMLYPYFGGKETSPNDMIIYLNKVENG